MAPLPDDVRRFVLTSIPSVPYLEAALWLRSRAPAAMAPGDLAAALYLPSRAATELLVQLHEAGLVDKGEEGYRYAPRQPALAEAMNRLADVYPRNLVGIATLIHDAAGRSAARFAEAFKLRKDS